MLTLPRAIHLLIEERAKVIALHAGLLAAEMGGTPTWMPTDMHRSAARRQIEHEHLTEKAKA